MDQARGDIKDLPSYPRAYKVNMQVGPVQGINTMLLTLKTTDQRDLGIFLVARLSGRLSSWLRGRPYGKHQHCRRSRAEHVSNAHLDPSSSEGVQCLDRELKEGGAEMKEVAG